MVRVAPIPSQASLDWSSLSLSELIADWSPEMNLSADWSEVFFTQFPLYYQRNHHHHKESGGAKESGKNFGRKRMKTRNRIIKWMTKMMAIESNSPIDNLYQVYRKSIWLICILSLQKSNSYSHVGGNLMFATLSHEWRHFWDAGDGIIMFVTF